MELKHFDKGRSHLRTVVADGKAASWLTVIDYRMRLGTRAVKMGAIAHVETNRQYRMKGYMRTLMADVVRYMRESGMVVSLVMGIPHFYYKFGFVSCYPATCLNVSIRDAEAALKRTKARKKYSARAFRPDDAASVLAIYDRNTSGTFGCMVRKADYFAGYPKERQEMFVIEDVRKRIVAYAVCDKRKDALRVEELATAEKGAAAALMARLAQIGVGKRIERMRLEITPSHPFAEFCRRCGCEWTTTYHRNADAMMQILDVQRFFKALAPLLTQRVRRSEFATRSASVALRTKEGAIVLRVRDGAVEVRPCPKSRSAIRLTPGELTQLAAGYRSSEEVLEKTGATASASSRRLLSVLFPRMDWRVWNVSRFEDLWLNPADWFPSRG